MAWPDNPRIPDNTSTPNVPTGGTSKPPKPVEKPDSWGDDRGPGGWGRGAGGGTPTPQEKPQPDKPTHPDKPTQEPPEGYEWVLTGQTWVNSPSGGYWTGGYWTIREIAGYQPPKPESELPEGWEWHWDGTNWIPKQVTDVDAQNRLRASFQSYLEMYGLNTPGMVTLIEEAVRKDWSMDKFLLEMRKHPDYLANPLFAANMERVKTGKRFLAEGEILAWRDESRRLAKQFGFEVSDYYLAEGLKSGLSHAEIEHRLQVQKNVTEFGAGVRWVFENELGTTVTDQDLFEIFDKERHTTEWDDAYRNALYRGRPLALGLGVRSQAEADAFRMLGVDPNAAFSRYENLRSNASRFERLGAIEDLITEGLPDDFGNLSTEENSTLVKALLFNDPLALQQLQDVVSREIARFKSAGPTATQGQLVGLLSGEERESYG